jgi:predicted dehydrogenase
MPAMLMSRNAEAVALGSRDAARAQEFAASFNIPKHYGSYQEVLDDPEVEAVYVPLPNDLHAEWTIRAAEAGKHVLCEKPMAVDGEEALRMADHCKNRGVILMEGFMYRLNPRTRMIRKVIDEGLIGDVRSVVVQFAFTIDTAGNSRLKPGKGAGSLMDVGCYCINFIRHIFGSEPQSVMASQHIPAQFGCDMTTSAILEFGDQRVAVLNCSFETGFRSSITVAGSKGVLTAEKFFTPPNEGKIGFAVETSDQKIHEFEMDAVNQFLLEIEHFSECVLEGKGVLLDPHKDAVGNSRAIDAIRESAATGCRAAVQG